MPVLGLTVSILGLLSSVIGLTVSILGLTLSVLGLTLFSLPAAGSSAARLSGSVDILLFPSTLIRYALSSSGT